ncbi:MAG TPA: ATP-binding cassette domain-containing protein [Polyangiaceae bacterium]|nr:ATP-binding cassette domain-containing protein [Polyangiaceae bacterium]
MIKRIYIDNFRCFSNFEIEPGRINLLFGLNGSGKSSFVDAIDRLVALVIDGREVGELFVENDLTRWDTRHEQRFEIDDVVDGQTFTYGATLKRISDGAGMVLHEERVSCGDRVLFRYEHGEVHLHRNDGKEGTCFPFRGNRSFIAGIEERPETTSLMSFLEHLGAFRSYKLAPVGMESVTHEEQQRLLKDGSNFASWYRHMSQERAGDVPHLFEQLVEVLPGFKSIALKGAGKQGRTRDLVVQMETGERSYEVAFDSLSDGQRALIVLYALLIDIRANSQTVLMDEPENYVGLSELQPWLQNLDEALGDAGQLFLISHHPEVIDFLAAENPILFERSAGGPVRVRNADFDREGGLKASEQISRGLLDGE